MLKRKLKTDAEIEALITGEEFQDIPLPDKHQRVGQLASAINEIDVVFPSMLTLAKTELERRFLLALVTLEPPPEAQPAAAPAAESKAAKKGAVLPAA